MRHVPLRVKLVALMLAMLAVALVVTGTVGTYSLEGYLVERVDAQLKQSAGQAISDCVAQERPGPGRWRGPALLSGYYVGCVDGKTGSINELSFTSGGDQRARPALPTNVQELDGPVLTVPAADGTGHDWRVMVAQQANGPHAGYIVVIALSLDEVDRVVQQQVLLTVAVGGGVLVLLALVAYLMVRSSLRPLVEVERTAEAIAAGDLTRRVPEMDPRTEVGGLAQALNVMLGHIERAFEERRRSEASARTAEEAARASEDRMRRFVADASHELRTPLTSIRGFAELYRQGGATPETGLIGRIEHHATRMGLLVDDLLLLARLDQQRPLDRRPVDLLALATDALIDARVGASGHRLRLRTAAGDDEDVEPALVLGDELRLRQVLANLLSNALTHTPAGTEITVFVGAGDEHAILEVADNGPGMSERDAARVFERFYRTDPSRTRAMGGSGLGLSIVAALVEAHGGTVSLRTAEGAGATFTVHLPLLKEGPPVNASRGKGAPS